MRTTFLLIRHGDNDWVGKKFAGRQAGVHLNNTGRAQAEALAERLAGTAIDAIYSSPLERAIETIEPAARRLGLPVRIREGLTELGTGDWTSSEFNELHGGAQWTRFNTFRSSTRPPSGELMVEIQGRMVTEMEALREEHPGGRVILVSHADVIRAAIALYAGIAIDLCHRLEIQPAGISTVALDENGVKIVGLNDTGALA